MTNHFVIQGQVVKPPRTTTSPAGIKHLHLVLDHRSQQVEAGMPRQCFVRIQVVASGDWSQQWANVLTVGCDIEVQGFLNRHETSQGVAKLVVHAQQLRKI